jgi:hypothetical protein
MTATASYYVISRFLPGIGWTSRMRVQHAATSGQLQHYRAQRERQSN